jgi:hypothetical protein
MPFDPKIIRSEDAPLTSEGDIDLPADFAALGQQLRDDAGGLANCYPAAPLPPRLKTPANRRYRLTITAICGSTAAAFLLAFAALQFGARDSVQRHINGRPDPLESPSFVSATTPTEMASFTELSQPELEALLDLMERDPSAVNRVSF